MTRGRKVLIGVGVFLVLGTAATLSIASDRGEGVEVRMEEIERRDLVSTVTASGNIRAARSVDISADISGRVTRLAIREGQDVEAGDVLLEIDPTEFASSVTRADASLRQARSQLAQQEASVAQARRELQRMRSLWERDSLLVSRQEVENAETQLEVAERQKDALEHGVGQAAATLQESRDRLNKTVIRAPISGRVTRLNVEEGETAVIGTMNNPGSLLLTIGGLDAMEAVVQVDETDIPHISLGDSATVRIDAFRDRRFPGTVTEIGNSAIQAAGAPGSTTSSASVDFEVVVTLRDPPDGIRPDLSATAEIVTASRSSALAIPIIALTIRDRSALQATADGEEAADDSVAPAEDDEESAPAPGADGGQAASDEPDQREVEGVFVVRDGVARFTPVSIGITGQEYFEVLTGVEEGDTVVAGPYQRIRDLGDEQRVRPMEAAGPED